MAPPSRLEGFREGRGWGRIPPVLLHGGDGRGRWPPPYRMENNDLMNVLYKYSDLLPLSYFDEPTIKISVTEFLNDPFEINASENIYLSMKNHLASMAVDDKAIEDLLDLFSETIKIMLSVNGVISLSETPRNSLMWAHYARQHNGICIGYKRDFLKHIKASDDLQIVINDPRKVNYDNLRFETDFHYKDNRNIDRDSIIQHLLKKSDEWIYEKEHRCIIPYSKANKIIVLNDNPKIDYIQWPAMDDRLRNYRVGVDFKPVIEEAIKRQYISKTETKNKYKINQEIINPARCSLLQSSKDSLFLIDISPESIESIYFGCKVSNEIIKPYFDSLHKKYKLYRFTLSKKRFELIPELLTADTF
ncbi:TPA: DUF2971 domain-containing protein [Aeromonas veronii]|nr:DUF2971 domain-containing protein [Aeromonas veronii]